MIRVGLVGYGLGGRVFHAPLIGLAPGLGLSAICSRSAEKQAAAHRDHPGASIAGDYDALLADKGIDLVVFSTPHDTHCGMACAAMAAGKHVVTDKVMCLSAAEGERMIDAARKAGVVFSVFQNRRWDGDFLTLRRLVSEGTLGKVYTLESSITTFGGPHGGWRAWKRHGGGRLWDWGAHLVDQALQLFGPAVDRVVADLEYRYPPDRSDVESAVHAVLLFRDGTRVALELGSHWMFQKPRFHVMAERGGFVKYGVDPQEAAMKLGTFGAAIPEDVARYHLKLATPHGPVEKAVTPEPGRYRAYYENIAAAIGRGDRLAVEPEQCLVGVRVIEAIAASAGRGEAVRL